MKIWVVIPTLSGSPDPLKIHLPHTCAVSKPWEHTPSPLNGKMDITLASITGIFYERYARAQIVVVAEALKNEISAPEL
jgi:hypothetical protein